MSLTPYERELMLEAQAALGPEFWRLSSRITDLLHGVTEPHDQPGATGSFDQAEVGWYWITTAGQQRCWADEQRCWQITDFGQEACRS